MMFNDAKNELMVKVVKLPVRWACHRVTCLRFTSAGNAGSGCPLYSSRRPHSPAAVGYRYHPSRGTPFENDRFYSFAGISP
jgi:hypothetical protein